MNPRRRITTALVGLLLLVLAVWAGQRFSGDSASLPEPGRAASACPVRATGW